jgi:integrase
MADAMRVNEYMENLRKQLIESRKIAESTSVQYLQSLWKLNGSKPFTSLAFTKKIEPVQKIIDGYAPSTQGTLYTVLSSALSTVGTKPTYKKAYLHWRTKMKEANDAKRSEDPHSKTETQEENWCDWDDVLEKKKDLTDEVLAFSTSTKALTPSQYNLLLDWVVLSLYTDIQPRRNADYLHMVVVRKTPKEYDATKNYYDMQSNQFVFNCYKTAKTYGRQVEDVPEALKKVLDNYIRHHTLARDGRKLVPEFKLLVKADGSPLNTVNAITRILNRIFGKKVGSSMLRHSFITHKYSKTSSDMEETAKAMGHSVAMQQGTYLKNDS